jgi:predicted metalloprotease with PDZ domain
MVFFLSPDEDVYSRYGGRCGKGPDKRQSLAGLRHVMKSVLAEHASDTRRFAPTETGKPFYITDLPPPDGAGFCIHCHHAKEAIHNRLQSAGEWSIDQAFRYPPPDNLGLILDVDRGNITSEVVLDSSVASAGLKKGDVIETLNQVPVHAFGDAQFALDRAPKTGSIEVTWKRAGQRRSGRIDLPDRWRRTDISWRPSLQSLVASARVYGKDLTIDEKKTIGLSAKQLAFRQKDSVPLQARKAGIRPGDIVLGFDDRKLEMSGYQFLTHVRQNYVQGESVIVDVIRDGKRLRLPMTFQ